MSITFGDLRVKLGVNTSDFDAGINRVIQKAKSIGPSIPDPKLGIDTAGFDRGISAVQKTVQDLARRENSVRITADTSTAEGRAERLQAVLSGVTDAQYVAQVHADTEKAHDELQELKRLFDRMDDTPEVIRVRAEVDQALSELGKIRRELKDIDGASVQTSTRLAGFGSTLASIGKNALGVASGIGIANVASNLLGTAFNFVTDAVVGANVELQNARATIMAFTKDGAAADQILADIREEAEKTPFAFQDMADAVGGLIPVARQANEPLMDLVEMAEILAASNPMEGLIGAAFALREAVSGDFTSIIERFNLPRVYINKLKEEGLPSIQIVRQAMQEMGYDITLVSNLSQTASGKWSTFMDTVREAGRRIGEPIFLQLKDGLDELIAFTETETFTDMVEDWTGRASDFALEVRRFVQEDGPGLVQQIQDIAASGLILAEVFIQVGEAVGKVTSAWEDLPGPVKEFASGVLSTLDTTSEFLALLGLGSDVLDGFGEAQYGASAATQAGQKATEDAAKSLTLFDEIYRQIIGTNNEYTTSLDQLRAMGDEASRSQQEYTESLGRQAEMAGLANERNSEYFLGTQAGINQITELSSAMTRLQAVQEDLAGAYQQGLKIQADYTAQGSEYAQQQSIIEEGNKILEERLAKGLITQEEYNQAIADGEYALARYEGGQEDATLTARDYAIQNAELMNIQDEIAGQFPELIRGSDEYNAKVEEAAIKAGISQGAIDDMKGSNVNLAGVIANELVPALQDLINKIFELDGKKATITVQTDYVITGDPGSQFYGSVTPTGGVGLTEGHATGGRFDEPHMGLVAEAGHPEWILPMDPAQRARALDMWQQAGMELGVTPYAEGGKTGGAVSGPLKQPGGFSATLTVDVDVEPIDFSFLFAGLDREAEDWGEQAGKKFIGFFKGNIAVLATGDLLADAKAELDDLFVIRQIAMDSGVTGEVIMQINQEIQAQEAEVAAIGASMGTDVVKGIAASIASGEAAQLLSEFREGIFDGLNLDGGDLPGLDAAIERLAVLRDAALEMGDTAQADRLTAEIAALNGELALTTQILETDAVQAWQANEEAAAAARAEAEAWAATFQGISNPGGLDRLQDDYRDKQIALQTAMLTPGTDPETLAQLQAEYDAALEALKRYEEGFQTALENGVFTQEELIELAAAGGDTLQQVIESGWLTAASVMEIAKGSAEGLEATLDAGLLSDAQIRELLESGNAAARAVIVGFFGPEVVAAWEDEWDNISESDYAALAAMEPKGEEMSQQWVDGVIAGLENGRLSVAQAIELLTDDAGEISEEAALSLLDTWRQIGADLDRALATGERLDEAQASYDQFMAFLVDFAARHGLVVDDIIADWERVEAQQNAAASAGGTSIGQGGSPGASADLDRILSEMVEFNTSQGQLLGIIEHVAGGNLDVTLADDTLSYLGEILNDPTLPAAFVEYVADGLAEQLDDLGIGQEDQLAKLNAELQQLGLEQLTAEQWEQMTRTEVEAIDDSTGRMLKGIDRQTNQLIAGMRRYMGGSTSSPAPVGSGSGVGMSGGVTVNATVTLDSEPIAAKVSTKLMPARGMVRGF